MANLHQSTPRSAVLHYTAPPVVGGVEAVIHAHAQVMTETGYPLTIFAGRGDEAHLPAHTPFHLVPKMDSQHPAVMQVSQALEQGQVPPEFESLRDRLAETLAPLLEPYDNIIVHNLFTKHFNLPLTAALFQLMDAKIGKHWIAWCHDFSWTSPNAAQQVRPGYPWDLLRTYRPEVSYVVVSEQRQAELAELLHIDPGQIQVIYNGVEPGLLLGLSPEGRALVIRTDLFNSDLILLMPVRVTQAKNIEFALRVVAALKSQGVTPRLIVTGPPDPHDEESLAYFHSLQALRQKLGVEQEMRFVFELGPKPGEPYIIDSRVVGDLFRVADVMFMPSHREGFGMPVLEAGLAGVQVISAAVPAAEEIGGEDIVRFDPADPPEKVAEQIIQWSKNSSSYRLKSRVRKNFTWRAIFRRQIEPLLQQRA